MIHKLEFSNYKAFKEGTIEIKPITILLGANSVGKSSVIQLFLLLNQTLNNTKKYETALRLNGEVIRMGEFENIIHRKITSNKLEFSIEHSDFNIKLLKKRININIENLLYTLHNINDLINKDRIIDNFSNFKRNRRISIIEDDYDKIFIELKLLKSTINKKLKQLSIDEADKIIGLYFSSWNYNNNNDEDYSRDEKKIILDINQIINSLKLVNEIEKIHSKNITLTYRFSQNKNILETDKISIMSENNNILTYEYSKVVGGKRHLLTTDYLENKQLLTKTGRSFGNKISIYNLSILMPENINDNQFIKTIFSIFLYATEPLKNSFSNSNINYVGPLRAFPKRYYFLDEEKPPNSLNIIDGNQLAEILKYRTDIKKKVNEWLIKFNFKVNVTQLKDVIHSLSINQNGLNLDITDVGFGISQILPIIV